MSIESHPSVVDEAGQAPVVAALERGSATGDAGPLARVDTHMSRIFLAPHRVYKLIRARRHPFVDMSDGARRLAACQAELALNRPLAPDLYLSVAAVTQGPDGAVTLNGPGRAVDGVIVMKRIAPGALFDEMAQAGRLTPDHLSDLAEVVAGFHASLAPVGDAGRPADYGRILDGLEATEAQAAVVQGAQPHPPRMFARLREVLARIAPDIEARRLAGFVRRGHGDLHLRNICLFEGRVTPFDALAFDDALATGDILYDFAFLLMDLKARGLAVHANRALNRYWDASGQPEAALRLLPFFMALRAAVRMAVAMEAGAPAESDRYHALALDLLEPTQPRLLAIGGLSGTGKSVLAATLAPHLPGVCGARLLRTDVVRKQAAGVAATERMRDDAYSPAARAAVYERLADEAREALDAGATVVADATFQEAGARMSIERAADGRPFAGLWLRSQAATRLARVAARANDASDITAQAAARQIEPDNLGQAWKVAAADGAPSDVAQAARRMLAARRGWAASVSSVKGGTTPD